MKTFEFFPARFSVLKAFVWLFLTLSFIARVSFLLWDFLEIDLSIFTLVETFLIGFLFDVATISFFTIPYIIYLLLVPKKLYGSILDKAITYFGFSIGVIIIFFSFFGEFTFWDEFHRRFNFIAVDYLVYTYEVVKNINESYPLPILIIIMLSLVGLSIFIISKLGYFKKAFASETSFSNKLYAAFPWIIIALFSGLFLSNNKSEFSQNRYNNELAKAGIYSFFAAFRNNELPYSEFYKTIPKEQAFAYLKKTYKDNGDSLLEPLSYSIYRRINNSDSLNSSIKPNVIFICVESLGADFLTAFGMKNNITPTLDSLANKSLFFENLYATGTRTIRGMEAITLSIPPTPGRSIVKRKNNQGLFTIGEVFKEKGYVRNFFYGGDGYFDNMNTYFGGNGFNIIDRGRGFLLDASITTTRTNIDDEEVSFENAWGVCDMDIYNKVLKEADIAHDKRIPFFDFVMTTSNHKPYTYPEGKIDIPSGTGREGAVKYTDYAINEFLKLAKQKPWYENTVVVIMGDHGANSAGRWELDVKNYHIPAFIINLPNQVPIKVSKLCSQIDLFPTLFAQFDWDYDTNFFGQNILKMKPEEERAFIGNYRKVGLLKDNKVMILDEQANADFFEWNPLDNSLSPKDSDAQFLTKTISYYEVADDLYRNGGLKIRIK